jgi:spore maturation protein CgeB
MKFKILVVGDFIAKIHEPAIVSALRMKNNDVEGFSYSLYYRDNTWLSSKITNFQIKFCFGPLIRKINRDLIQFVNSNNFDLVFFYRPRFIDLKVLCLIKKDSFVYFFNNDDPFSLKYPKWYWRKYLNGLKYCDHIFSYRPKNILDYHVLGYKNVTLFPPYFISTENFPLALAKDIDVVFIGHFEDDGRDEWLKFLIDNGIQLKIYGPEWRKSRHYNYFSSMMGDISPIKETYNYTLNISRIALVFLSNLNCDTYTRRCFEITATKTFMLSIYSDDLAELFEPGIHADYFKTKDELLKKVIYYLDNIDLRESIALAGYKRVIEDGHSVVNRINTITEQIHADWEIKKACY